MKRRALRYCSASARRIVVLTTLPPLGYVEVEPPRFRVALYEMGTGAPVSEVRYRHDWEARRAFSRRVRELEGNRPARFRAAKALARQTFARALNFERARERAERLLAFGYAEHAERQRDRLMILAQVGAISCDEIRAENPR